MGLPPDELADANKFQGIHPSQPGQILQCWAEQTKDDKRTRSFHSNRSGLPEDLGWEEQARRNSALGKFVHSNNFQNTTLAVIVLNGMWIGIDVEWNHPHLEDNGKSPLDPTATVIENLFCTYFTFELIVRFMAFKEKKHCFEDKWFFFDLALVLFMVIETWILVIVEAIIGGEGGGFLSKFSALRLLRLTRLTRLFKSLPELLTLIKGMINAARAVATVLCFMVLIMYVFSILFTVSIGDSKAPELKIDPYWDTGADPTGVDLFGSIGDSMMTLFTRGVLGDNLAETLEAIKDRGGSEVECSEDDDGVKTCERSGGSVWMMWLFIIFMIISAFCLLNMIVGILCGVIDETAKEESESRNVDDARRTLTQVFTEMDTSQDGLVTKHEWGKMVRNDSVRTSLVKIGLPENEKELDEKLAQVEENVFPKESELAAQQSSEEIEKSFTEGSSPDALRRMPSRQEEGIDIESFVQRVLANRDDVDASRLDVEVLRAKVIADERCFSKQLEKIEDALLDFKKKCPSQLHKPQMSATNPNGIRAAGGEPKSGPPSSAVWLQSIPTEALFSALERRAKLKPQVASEVD